MLRVTASPSFSRIAKKLHPKEKKSDLAGVFVFKFKLNLQETLLAYELKPDKFKPSELVLLAVGPHKSRI